MHSLISYFDIWPFYPTTPTYEKNNNNTKLQYQNKIIFIKNNN